MVNIIFVFMLLDLVVGIIKGIYNKNFSSRKLVNGIIRKILIIILCFICYLFDTSVKDLLGLNIPYSLYNLFGTSVILGDIVSILENYKEMGVALPKFLSDMLDVKEKE